MANDFTARVAGISVELGMSVQNKSGIWCKPTVKMDLKIDGGTNPQQREAIIKQAFDEVCDNIEKTISEIGHTVTVVSAVGKTVNIKSRITLNDGYQWSQVKPKAEETLEAYFLEMRKNWEKGNLVVRISQIENRLLNLDGILDVADTKLNDVASNLALAQEEIPLLGGVSIG